MSQTAISDAELSVVAAVAGREAWTDLSAPPVDHPPRTLAEELAVARFSAAVPARRRGRRSALNARLAVAALTVGVLGACWWVSPTRTAIGLLGAGLFSLIALHRRRGRTRSGGFRPRSGGLRLRAR